jgi:hypothetical protein
VAAVTGSNAAAGLYAGNLTVSPGNGTTPTAADYNIGNLTQTAGSVTAVTITPKPGKSTGARTIYYDGNTAVPQTQGEYTVTFDVAAATGWDAVTGLFAGTLTVNGTGNSGRTIGFLELARMDIEDAHTVFIAQDELYTITDTGKIQEVVYTYKDKEDNTVTRDGEGNIVVKDKDGNDITDEIEGNIIPPKPSKPNKIYVLNDDYIIVSYGYNHFEVYNNNYLVNSKTGACYKYTGGMPYNESGLTGKLAISSYGNSVYIHTDYPSYELIRISLDDIDNISISTISAPNDRVEKFGIDKYGNVAYAGTNAMGVDVLRYRKSVGGFEILSGGPHFTYNLFWTGFDGNLFHYNLSLDPNVKKIIGNPFTIDDYGDIPHYTNGEGLNILKMKNKDRMLIIGRAMCSEIYNGLTQQITNISYNIFGISTVSIVLASNNYYYLFGISNGTPKYVFLKINPEDNSYKTLIDGGYEMYKMTVTSDDVVAFNALRMSDGAIVIGEISATGVVRILDATLTNEVVVLERIR